MKVALISSEVVPFAKVGGLADVAGSLPKALEKNGIDVKVFLPKYKKIEEEKFGLKKISSFISVPIKDTIKNANIWEGKIGENIQVFFIENEEYFGRDNIYGYYDDPERYIFFSRATIEVLKRLGFIPDVIHANDWQTGLIPVYLKTLYKTDEFFKDTGTLYTIHNLAYQGVTDKEHILTANLPWSVFNIDGVEYYGNMNMMKGGIIFSDAINTVSKKYAEEIQTPQYGEGLEGVLLSRKDRLFGIVNGIDYEVWNPETDKDIKANYNVHSIERKIENKRALKEENGLTSPDTTPLFGLISRLVDQKGLDILLEGLDEIMSLDLEFIILGTGDEKYHIALKEMVNKYPNKLRAHIMFDPHLARRIYAGVDFFLMPSRFEPCGLGQLISLRYGTIPVVRKTGGLADTVMPFDPEKKIGNGIVFEKYSKDALVEAVRQAVKLYEDKENMRKCQENAMSADYSWNRSANEYIELYKKVKEFRKSS